MADTTTGGVRVTIEIWYDAGNDKITFSGTEKDFGPKGLIGNFIPGSAAEQRAKELLVHHGKPAPP